MKRRFRRYFQNLKNRVIFGQYGRDVFIYPGVLIVRPKFIAIGDSVLIGGGTQIYVHPRERDSEDYILRIGSHVHIGAYNIIGARQSIVIEENVLLGPYVVIGDHRHRYEDVETPIRFQGVTEGVPIRIERDSWIGANVFVSPGVTIGRHSVIGANSVVTRDIPPYSVAVGSPARVIKKYDFNLKRWGSDDER